VEDLEKQSGLNAKVLKELLGAMVRSGEIVRAGTSIYFGRRAFEGGRDRILEFIAKQGAITTAEAKTLTGVSRKYLIPFLEALDKAGVTVRMGEVRKARGNSLG
jgi:selenocysteine-specific elongation factor